MPERFKVVCTMQRRYTSAQLYLYLLPLTQRCKKRFLRFLFMSRFYVFNLFSTFFIIKKRWSYFYILHIFYLIL